MAGERFCVLPPTAFDFSNIGQAGAALTYVLAQRIAVSEDASAVLQARVHAVNIATSGDTIDIYAVADGFTLDDPVVEYPAATPQLANVHVAYATVAPAYLMATLSGVGEAVKITLVVTKLLSVASTLKATLSVDLVLRSRWTAKPAPVPRPGSFQSYLDERFSGYLPEGRS